MYSRLSRWVVAVLLVIVFPVSMMMAQNGGAMVYTNGGVLVNGHNVTDSSAIVAGDRVETAKSGATVVANGASVVLSAGSALAYAGDSVTLDAGSALVRANKGFSMHVAGVTITPQDGAQFSVSRNGNTVKVSTTKGSVSLLNGKESVVIASGNSYTSGEQVAKIPAAKKAMSEDAGLLTAIGLAVAAGVALGIYNANNGTSSPSVP
jgi:ferric-dicitrate binding protein FerR (iron transport regulator)